MILTVYLTIERLYARNMICLGGGGCCLAHKRREISFRGGQIRARKQYLAHRLVCFSLFQN